MLNKERQAENEVDSEQMPIAGLCTQMPQTPMLAAADGVWSIREFEVSPEYKIKCDCAVYEMILDFDGVLILKSSEYSNRDSSGVLIMKERLEAMILKLNAR